MKTITLVATFVMKFWVIVENQPALLDVVAVGTLHAMHAAVNLCEVEAKPWSPEKPSFAQWRLQVTVDHGLGQAV